jgi:hypothetical protein
LRVLGIQSKSVRTALALPLLALSLAACGGGGVDSAATDDPSTTTRPTPESTTTTLDEATAKEAAAEEAYLAYWDAHLDAVNEPVNPRLPELQELMTGQLKLVVTRNLEELEARGQAVRLPDGAEDYGHIVTKLDLTNDGAHLSACSVDNLVTYDIATARAVDDSVATKWYEADLVEEANAWKVSAVTLTRRVEGVQPCPA